MPNQKNNIQYALVSLYDYVSEKFVHQVEVVPSSNLHNFNYAKFLINKNIKYETVFKDKKYKALVDEVSGK